MDGLLKTNVPPIFWPWSKVVWFCLIIILVKPNPSSLNAVLFKWDVNCSEDDCLLSEDEGVRPSFAIGQFSRCVCLLESWSSVFSRLNTYVLIKERLSQVVWLSWGLIRLVFLAFFLSTQSIYILLHAPCFCVEKIHLFLDIHLYRVDCMSLLQDEHSISCDRMV